MPQEVDLGSRLKAAFGIAPGRVSSALKALGFVNRTNITSAALYPTNDGSFENLTISGNGQELKFEYTGMTSLGNVFGPPPMISYQKSKNLTITEIDGANAEVVERYGDRSWRIRIEGLLIDLANHQFPVKKVEQIRKLFDTPAPFAVTAEIFDALGIKSIYFTDIDLQTVAGFEDTISFVLTARSIRPTEFQLAQ